MDKTQMIEILRERFVSIRDELLSLEQQFNQKKEEFLKVQGALEVLNELNREEEIVEEISEEQPE